MKLSSVLAKKVGGFNKKESGSLDFAGLEIPKDYLMRREGIDMKGYENPNMPPALGLGACFITPLKAAVVTSWCWAYVSAIV